MSSRAHTSSGNDYGDTSNAGYLRLQHARSPYYIELSAELVPHLLTAIADGAQQNSEVGGLLIGSYPKAAALTLRIEDFVPIERRTGDGAPYNLTPEQRARLSTTRHRLIQKQTPVLGFFRSHLRPERLELSPEDRDLLATEFRRAVHVALVIEADAPHAAAFFVPGLDGALQSGPPLPEMQFSAAEIARFFPHSQQQAAIEAGPVHKMQSAAGAPEGTVGKRASDLPQRLATWIYAAAAALVLLLCLSLTTWAPATARFLSGQATLRLSVAQNANMLEVHWNAKQRDLERTGKAILRIQDEAYEQQYVLTASEIRFGAVSYQPRSRHVAFSLAVPLPDSAELVQRVEWTRR